MFSGDGIDTAAQFWVCGNKNTVSSFYIPLFSLEWLLEPHFFFIWRLLGFTVEWKQKPKPWLKKAKYWDEKIPVISLLRLWKDDGAWLFTIYANKVTCFFQAQIMLSQHSHLLLLAKWKKIDEQKIFTSWEDRTTFKLPKRILHLCPWRYSWCRWMKPCLPNLW